MKFVILLSCIVIGIAGCERKYTDNTEQYPLPPEMSDCKIWYLQNNGYGLTAVRCPNSTTTTTYQKGKSTETVIVVDGVEYIKKEK